MVFLWLLLVVLLMGALATLLTRATVAYMGKHGGQAINDMHAAAEYIVDTHAVPPPWQERRRRKVRRMPRAAGVEGAPAPESARARRICLRRLAGLIRHFERTSLVADEEARAILVGELEKVRGEWEGGSWEQICRPRGGQ